MMDTPQRKIYCVRSFTAAEEEEETFNNFLFDGSFDISNSLDSGLFAGCELNNVTCTPICSSTNLRTMEQTRIEAHVEELLNKIPAMNSEVNNSESRSESHVQPLEASQSTSTTPVTTNECTTISNADQLIFLQTIFDGISSHFPELAFTMAHEGNSNVPVLMIAQKNLFHHPSFGLTSRIQLTVQYKKYTAYVLMQLWKEGEVKTIEDVREVCHDFSNVSKCKFCPGIDPDYYEEEYHKVIRFHIKSVRVWHFP